jgi:hypothetical protein
MPVNPRTAMTPAYTCPSYGFSPKRTSCNLTEQSRAARTRRGADRDLAAAQRGTGDQEVGRSAQTIENRIPRMESLAATRR